MSVLRNGEVAAVLNEGLPIMWKFWTPCILAQGVSVLYFVGMRPGDEYRTHQQHGSSLLRRSNQTRGYSRI